MELERVIRKDVIDILDKEYGEGNWKLRAVSSNTKYRNIPSLTLTRELSRVGIRPKDFVIVAIKDDYIIIKKI